MDSQWWTRAASMRAGSAEIDLDELARTGGLECGDEGSPAVAEDGDGAGQVGTALGQVAEEVLVGRVPGAQLVARVLGEAGQREGAP